MHFSTGPNEPGNDTIRSAHSHKNIIGFSSFTKGKGMALSPFFKLKVSQRQVKKLRDWKGNGQKIISAPARKYSKDNLATSPL